MFHLCSNHPTDVPWQALGHLNPLQHTLVYLDTHKTQIKTQRKYIYKEDTNSFPCVTWSCTSKHCTSWKACTQYIGKHWPYELASHKPTHTCTWSKPTNHISNSMTGLWPTGQQGQITEATSGLCRVYCYTVKCKSLKDAEVEKRLILTGSSQ